MHPPLSLLFRLTSSSSTSTSNITIRTMPSSTLLLAILAISVSVSSVAAFVTKPNNSGGLASSPLKHQHQQLYALTKDEANNCNDKSTASSLTINSSSRRRWIQSIAAPAASALPYLLINESASAAAASKTKGSPCDPGDAICRQKVYDRYVDSLQEGRYELPPGQPIPGKQSKVNLISHRKSIVRLWFNIHSANIMFM